MVNLPRERGIAVALVLVGVIGGGLYAQRAPQAVPPLDLGSPTAVVSGSSTVPVHVSGWVHRPGVVWVADGALTADVIEQAGGALDGARLDAINLARPVTEGDQVHVPGPGGSGETSGHGEEGLVDLNTADEAELQTLPGVGPVLAARIVSHRESVGRFEAIEDLLDVPGIGETRLQSIRDLIRPP